MTRILHILPTDRISGAENVVCNLIRIFREEAAYEMAYCSPDGDIRNTLEKEGISFLPLKEFTPKEIKRTIREYQPDIIQAHDMRASVMVALVSRRIPIVAQIHNNAYDARRISKKSLAFLLAMPKLEHIVWVSKGARDGFFFHRLAAKKSSVIYNIIDAAAIQRRANAFECQAYDAVFIGRLTYPKNPERLIHVIERIYENNHSLRFAITGSGELETSVRQMVKDRGLSDAVTLTGRLENPYPLLQRAKVLLMTSRWEGLPLSVLEALALGVPVVSTPVEGVSELMDPKMSFLSDDDEALAAAVNRILSSKALQENMAKYARIFSEKHNDKDSYRETWKRIYEQAGDLRAGT